MECGLPPPEHFALNSEHKAIRIVMELRLPLAEHFALNY
jgi:hypothetical protein